ncbi:MAG: 30S ribosomal protein S16 [Bacteroidetes bacterium]|nr:30S ribosomal protein S16 [Bacteroidota bacterium]
MATKIRLQRQGRKGRPIFHIVVADSRAPRDGRYIERLGIYNPNTNPATIDINFDKTLDWVQKGASLTDTSRAILSYKGILHKNHLLNGVKKGALTLEQVEEKFSKWLDEKESKITNKISLLSDSKNAKTIANLEREKSLKEAKAAKILLKNSALAEEVNTNSETSGETQVEIESSVETAVEENANVEPETTEESVSIPSTDEVSSDETPENSSTQE